MSVIRIHRVQRDGFTTLSHHAVRNPDLSRSARGLLWELCSHSPEFDVTVRSLTKASPDGKHRLQKAKSELEEGGYLRVDRPRGEDGKLSSSLWLVTDDPEMAPLPPRADYPHVENPHVENQHTIERTKEEGTSSSSLRSEDESQPDESSGGVQGSLLPVPRETGNGNGDEPWNGGVIFTAWCDQNPEVSQAMSPRERGKLGAACKRLAEDHSPGEVRAAWWGIQRLYPFSDGRPWDPMDLEKHFVRALAKAAANHPATKEREMDQMVEDLKRRRQR